MPSLPQTSQTTIHRAQSGWFDDGTCSVQSIDPQGNLRHRPRWWSTGALGVAKAVQVERAALATATAAKVVATVEVETLAAKVRREVVTPAVASLAT